jgi:hypothetical protein
LVFRKKPALGIIKVEEGGNNPAKVEGSGVRDDQITKNNIKPMSLVCEKRMSFSKIHHLKFISV